MTFLMMSPRQYRGILNKCLHVITLFVLVSSANWLNADPEPPEPVYPLMYLPAPPPAVLLSDDILISAEKEPVINKKLVEIKEPVQQLEAIAIPPVPETDPQPAGAEKPPAVKQTTEILEPAVIVRPGDRFSLYFEGSPWLYTALMPIGEGIKYEGRSREDAGDRLLFTAKEQGEYLLRFVLGTSSPGDETVATRAVSVVAPDMFLTAIGVGEAQEITGDQKQDSGSGDFPGTEEAWVSASKGSYERALEYFSHAAATSGKNLHGEIYILSVLCGRKMEDANEAFIYDLDERGKAGFILKVIDLGSSFDKSDYLRLLETAAADFAGFNGYDHLLYTLAGMHESLGEVRNYRAAVKYYNEIISMYPLSKYWEESKQRRNYIERHFLLVR